MRLAPLKPVVTLALTLSLAGAAQAQEQLERPDAWKTRFDRPAPDSALYFVEMPPGWHITTGPSGILYLPSQQAEGTFRVRSEIHLFPGEQREGFGIFIGGRDLDGAERSYLYFLINGGGRFLIKRRVGEETEVLVPWTEHSAVAQNPGTDESTQNVLSIHAGAEQVEFLINGERVTSLPRAELDCDGIVGLRVNHGLNLHVTELAIDETD